MTITRRSVVCGLGAGAMLAGGDARATETILTDLRARVQQMTTDCDVPGLAFGLVRNGRVVAVDGFGFADREQRLPVRPTTVFLTSSISKVVTGTALMQLWERNLFRLDDPISVHLDFPVTNPRHGEPITFRHLFNHTSSISDRNYGPSFATSGDSSLALQTFLSGYLSKQGRWFTAEGSYNDYPPGQRFSYSNVGIALAAYLGERLARRSLKDITARQIFRPLDMSPAAWSLADLHSSSVAVPYVMTGGKLSPGPQIGYPDWPSGLLRTTAAALARFLACYAAGGRTSSSSILREPTVRTMIELHDIPAIDFPVQSQGLFWEGMRGEGARIVSKGGSDPGAHSLIGFSPATGSGAVILTNRDPSGKLQRAMQDLIRRAAA